MHKSVIVPFTDSPGIVCGLCVLVIYFWNSAVAVVCPNNMNGFFIIEQLVSGTERITYDNFYFGFTPIYYILHLSSNIVLIEKCQ
jgi:hypothetical protein